MSEYILNENCEYALRVLLYLMPYGNVAPMTEAAGYMQVQREKLRTVGSRLNLAGIVKRVAGAYGGYTLLKDPKEISIYNVVMCMEYPKNHSESTESNAIAKLFTSAQADYIEKLKNITLYDLYMEIKQMR